MAATFEGILLEASKYILAHHVTRLATGYLGFSLSEITSIEKDEKDSADMIRFQCLNTFYTKHPGDGKKLLCQQLTKAGQEEGIVQKKAIDIIAGKYNIHLNEQYTNN